MRLLSQLCLIILPLLLATGPAMGQTLAGNEAITIQGKGAAKTRTFTLSDNWHVEVVSDGAVKIDAVASDATSNTLISLPAAIPPPPSYSGSSALVAKGGTYSLTIDGPGAWQVIITESGFTKNLAIGGAPATPSATPSASPLPAVSAAAVAPIPPAPQVQPVLAPGTPYTPPRERSYRAPVVKLERKSQPDLNTDEKTDAFTGPSHWYLRWTSSDSVSIKLLADNQSPITLVADTGTAPASATMTLVPQSSTGSQGGYPGFQQGGYTPSYVSKETGPKLHRGTCMGAGTGNFRFEVEGSGTWTLAVYDDAPSSYSQQQSFYASQTSNAPAAAAPATPPTPAAPPAAPVAFDQDKARAVVLIKGDNAQGTGFLIKTPNGPAVITNIHVIANNPNLKVTTNTGALVEVLSEKGASDRDLALLAIKDNGYSYMEFSPDISKTVQPGDEVITPGNSQGGEVMLNTGGKVLGIGPVRIEFDNPIYHGNSGGPVFHSKSGKVLGVVTEAIKNEMNNEIDKASFSSRNSAISGSMRYFGLRLDTVSAWIPIDSRRFQIETTFLDQFHEQSRRLDAYLNHNDNDREEAARLYHADAKIMKAVNQYSAKMDGADTAQRIDQARSLIFDLQCVADLDLNQIGDKNNFYSFNQERAQDEFQYRKALKTELDSIGNNVERISTLPRSQ